MTLCRLLRLSILLALSVTGAYAVLAQVEVKREQKILRDSINGSAFEMMSGGSSERYRYDGVSLEGCALKWNEEHETRNSGQRVIKEVIETTVPLEAIDEKQAKPNSLKNGGYLVSLVTKGLENQILTRQRTQWGDEPEAVTTGVTSGRGLYFANRQAAETVSEYLGSSGVIYLGIL
jgi:hypothetical protein